MLKLLNPTDISRAKKEEFHFSIQIKGNQQWILTQLKLLRKKTTQHSQQGDTCASCLSSVLHKRLSSMCRALPWVPCPHHFLLKMDKQGEGTVLFQNQLKKVPLALSVLLGSQTTLGVKTTNSTLGDLPPPCARDPDYHKFQMSWTQTFSAPFPHPDKVLVTPGNTQKFPNKPCSWGKGSSPWLPPTSSQPLSEWAKITDLKINAFEVFIFILLFFRQGFEYFKATLWKFLSNNSKL